MSLSEDSYSKFLDEFTEYFDELREHSYDKYPEKLRELSEFRKIPLETLEEAEIFYIGKASELLNPAYLDKLVDFGVISPTNRQPIYTDRYVFPIKDISGRVINHVGYNAYANERYMYGTSRYYSRLDDLYGMENFNIAVKLGFAFLTEGITDTLAIRSIGYPNTFAYCGTRKSNYKNLLLNRLKYGIIKIPDNDYAGRLTIPKWDFERSFLINTPLGFKDSASILEHPEWREHYTNCFAEIVKELVSTYGNGRVYKDYSITL